MKKLILFSCLVALLPAFASCGGNNGGNNVFEEPRFIQYAGQLIPSEGPLQFIELTESGRYVIASLSTFGKANGDLALDYKSGSFTVSGNTYNLAGYGTIRFDRPTKAETTVSLTITPSGGSPVTVSATFKEGTTTGEVFRTWRIDKTHIKVDNAALDFNGCKLSEICEFLKNNGIDVGVDYKSAPSVTYVSITSAGGFVVEYSNGKVDYATLTGSIAKFAMGWKTDSFEEIFGTSASATFESGKCIFSVTGKVDNSAISGQFVLSPVD